MYADPKDVRDHVIKIRINESTYQLIEALAQFHHTQKAVLAKDLFDFGLERLVAESTTDQQVA